MESIGVYESVFKINGYPILPPLMTNEIRLEMQYYKKLAIERESKRASQQSVLISEEKLSDTCEKSSPAADVAKAFDEIVILPEIETDNETETSPNKNTSSNNNYKETIELNKNGTLHKIQNNKNEPENQTVEIVDNTITEIEYCPPITIKQQSDNKSRTNLTYINSDSSTSSTSDDDSMFDDAYGNSQYCSEYLKVSSFLQDARLKAAEYEAKHRKLKSSTSEHGVDNCKKFDRLKKYTTMYSILQDETSKQLKDDQPMGQQQYSISHSSQVLSTSSSSTSTDDGQQVGQVKAASRQLFPNDDLERDTKYCSNSNIICEPSIKSTVFSSSAHHLEVTSPTVPKLIRSNSYTLEKPSPLLIQHINSQNNMSLAPNVFHHAVTMENLQSGSPPNSLFKAEQEMIKKSVESKFLMKGKTDTDLIKPLNAMQLHKPGTQVLRKNKPKNNANAKDYAKIEERLSMYNSPTMTVAKKTHSMKRNKTTPYSELIANAKSYSKPLRPTNMKPGVNVNNSPRTSNDSKMSSELSGSVQRDIGAIKNSSKRESALQQVYRKKPTDAKRGKSPVKMTTTTKYSSNNFEKILQEIQDKHSTQMMELMKRQEQEQKVMQENFRKQQEELMKHIENKFLQNHAINSRLTTSTPTLIDNHIKHNADFNSGSSLSDGLSSSPATTYLSNCEDDPKESCYGTSSNNDYYSCIGSSKLASPDLTKEDNNNNKKQRFVKTYIPSVLDNLAENEKDLNANFDQNCNISTHTNNSSYYNEIADINLLQKRVAATTINAWARGYLVRRLFRTEHVQSIVNIIKDTLIFILDLHHERTSANYGSEVTDIKLKQRLLQQLTTACYSLHNIFIDLSTAQRMEIIQRDRQNIKNKLSKSGKLNLHRTESTNLKRYINMKQQTISKKNAPQLATGQSPGSNKVRLQQQEYSSKNYEQSGTNNYNKSPTVNRNFVRSNSNIKESGQNSKENCATTRRAWR